MEVLEQNDVIKSKYKSLKELNNVFFNNIEKIQERYNCNADCCIPNIKHEVWSCGKKTPCEKSCKKIKYDYLKKLDKICNKVTLNDLYNFITTVMAVIVSMILCIFPLVFVLFIYLL